LISVGGHKVLVVRPLVKDFMVFLTEIADLRGIVNGMKVK
jgi:hypothetical protein